MPKQAKSQDQKPYWQLLLSISLLLTLAGCSTYPVQISFETEQKTIWLNRFQFGENHFPGGGLGGGAKNTGRGRKSYVMGRISIPASVTFRWKKSAHYTKSKNFPVHEYTVQLPKKMPELKPKEVALFLFVIKNDNTVSVEVSAY